MQAEAMPRFLAHRLLHDSRRRTRFVIRQRASYTSPDVTAPPFFHASTEQRVGLGFGILDGCSLCAQRERGAARGVLQHLETITATGGLTPKYHRDQIEFRIYYRLRARGR